VHGPDYEGQKSALEAIQELDIQYPIADNQNKDTWEAYGIGARPAYALTGSDGSLLHRQIGKATTDDVKARIEAALGQ
jgi:hypothetical protein